MTLIFRTTDNTKWGTGKGSNLTASEIDNNFYDLYSQFLALQDHVSAGAGIDYFSVTGSQFYVHLTNHTILGPYQLPASAWNFRGEWTAATNYTALDVITYKSGVYLVLRDHTSASSFDPGANAGPGLDYYQLMWSLPGVAVNTITTATYSPVLTDANTYMRCTNATGCDISIEPDSVTDFPIGTELHFRDATASGAVNISALSPAILNIPTGYLSISACHHATIGLKKVAANEWDIFGLLAIGSP